MKYDMEVFMKACLSLRVEQGQVHTFMIGFLLALYNKIEKKANKLTVNIID